MHFESIEELNNFTKESMSMLKAANTLGLSKKTLALRIKNKSLVAYKVLGMWRIPHNEILRIANNE